MDNNQDQGHEGHAFRCSETVEGYELSVSERQTHSNASESDDNPHSQGPNSLDTGNNEKLNVGTGEILLSSSGDELFLDANANFSDGAASPRSKEPLRDSSESATDEEIGNIKYQEFSSGSSSDFNDVNQFIVKGQMQDPSILQRERVKEGNMLELQGQLSGSHVDPPSSSSITDLRTIEDRFGLSSDSNPSKGEAAPDLLLENKIYAGENVRQEMGEENVNIFTSPVCDDSADVTHPQNDHLSEKREVLPPDGTMTDQESWEIVSDEMHDEESIGVSSVKFITESDKTSDEIGASMNCMKFTMIEDYLSNFSDGVYKSDDVVEMDKFEKCDITDIECATNKSTPSGAQEDIEDNEINSSCRVNKECNRLISTSANSHQTQNAELSVKAAEEPGRNDSSLYSLGVEPSAQCVSVVRETQGEVSGITVVPVQDQSGNKNNNVQLPSSAIHTSIDYGIQCDSLEGNRDSVSGIPSNLNDPKAAYEIQKGLNQQHPSSTSSQAGWFTRLVTEVTNESQGREKNEEIIAEITNDSTSEQQTPPQSPLSEAAHSNNRPESPKLEESPIFGKNGESAVVKGEGDINRQNKKVKSKLYYCPLFWCCSSVDSPPR
ncbi:hypothetical protein JHK87_032283 [Glycine soja]|nr:hypothetical protein JHK87_032283 [Glycine soja]